MSTLETQTSVPELEGVDPDTLRYSQKLVDKKLFPQVMKMIKRDQETADAYALLGDIVRQDPERPAYNNPAVTQAVLNHQIAEAGIPFQVVLDPGQRDFEANKNDRIHLRRMNDVPVTNPTDK